jgi:hypothetical protein
MAFDDVDMNQASAPLYDSVDLEKRDLHSQLEDLFHTVWVAERLDRRKAKTSSAIDALDSASNTDCCPFDRNDSSVPNTPVLRPGWRQGGLLRAIRRLILTLVRMVWVTLNVIAWLTVALVPIVVALLALLVLVCVYVVVAILINAWVQARSWWR